MEIRAPLAVPPGASATLTCHFDLEGDPLYTVKWYKGSKEFYRYVPKELPHTRVFPVPGVNVDVSIVLSCMRTEVPFKQTDVPIGTGSMFYQSFVKLIQILCHC